MTIFKKLIWNDKRSPIPDRTEPEMVSFRSGAASELMWDFEPVTETLSAYWKQDIAWKYSIILPVMKSLSCLPHVALTWLSGTIYGSSHFDTLPEEMSENVLIIPKVLRPQQNIWRLSFQFSRAILSFLFFFLNSWLTYLL